MTTKEIIDNHNKICEYAASNKILDAFSLIGYFLKQCSNDELISEFNNSVKIYENILSYTIKGIKDPKRDQILKSLVVTIFEIADKLKELLLEKHNYSFHNQKISSIHKYILFREKVFKILSDLKIPENIKSEQKVALIVDNLERTSQVAKEDIFTITFDYLIYTEKLTDKDVDFIKLLFNFFKQQWHFLSLIVSGLTLSIIRSFDIVKLEILLEIYRSSNIQIKQRALVGLLLTLVLYDNRINFNKALETQIKKIYSENLISELDVMMVIIQFLKAKQTEDITRKMREEIIPELRKLTPKIEEKLDLKNILSEDISQDKHPDWQTLLEDTPDLLNKIEDLSKMQVEGNDVFMSTFSMLKHFKFFNKISNWFIPFYKDNPEIRAEFSEQNVENFFDTITTMLEDSSYMCNSDKYSFLFNVVSMPVQQREMLVNMYKAEIESMNELGKEDELLDAAIKNNVIITQYIQDLYRFFKLHAEKDIFGDIFLMKFNIYNKQFFKTLFSDESIILKMGDFYFKTEKYKEALEIFQELLKTTKPTIEILQKVAYCYQKTGDYTSALDYYLKAELFDTPQPWLLKKIGLCYFNLRNYEKALIYYLDAEKSEPENSQLCMSIANCYLNLKDYKNALNYYYKIEVLFKENYKIYRPIAWCLFVTGNLAKAEDYLMKIFDNDIAGSFDYLIYGHIKWIKGELSEAANSYIKSIEKSKNGFNQFLERIKDDIELLLDKGIQKSELHFMIDYIRLQTDKLI